MVCAAIPNVIGGECIPEYWPKYLGRNITNSLKNCIFTQVVGLSRDKGNTATRDATKYHRPNSCSPSPKSKT